MVKKNVKVKSHVRNINGKKTLVKSHSRNVEVKRQRQKIDRKEKNEKLLKQIENDLESWNPGGYEERIYKYKNKITLHIRGLGDWENEESDWPDWLDHQMYTKKFKRFVRMQPWFDEKRIEVNVYQGQLGIAEFVIKIKN